MKIRAIWLWGVLVLISGLMAGNVLAQAAYEEIVVNFEDTATDAQIEELEKEYGVDFVYNSIFSKPEVLMRFPTGQRSPEDTAQLMQKLTDEDAIEYAEPNYFYQADFAPNDTMYAKQWNFKMINTESAWDKATGKGAIVAVIDTGVAFEDYKDGKGTYHRVPDLACTKFVKGYDFIDDDEHANDDHAHGTHVAGTIAQCTNNKLGVAGVAYEAAIMPLKVLNRYGQGNIADITEAIVYAADHGAHVINMSLGGMMASQTMREAVEYAYKKGVTVVCAAGNAGDTQPHYPAAYPYAFAVSSVGPDGELAPYSSYGSWIDMAAPGGNTRTKTEDGVLQNTIGRMDPTKDGYEYFQGTSMASPHVAGVAALLVSQGIKDPKKIESILLASATKKDDKTKYGAGILNAFNAVKAAGSDETQAAPAQDNTQPAPATSAPAQATQIVQAESAAKKPPFKFTESMLYFLSGVGFSLLYFKLLSRSDSLGKIASFIFGLAMFLTSSGVFFVHYLPIPFVPKGILYFLSSPLPNLDRIFFGYSFTALNPIFHSVLLPLVLLVALLGNKWGKAFALGVAVGMTAHLFVDAFFSSANVVYLPGTFLFDKLWLVLNGVFCFGLAYLAGKRS